MPAGLSSSRSVSQGAARQLRLRPDVVLEATTSARSGFALGCLQAASRLAEWVFGGSPDCTVRGVSFRGTGQERGDRRCVAGDHMLFDCVKLKCSYTQLCCIFCK